ncbi:MAG: hypothetical protein DF168_01205 [Candidatus Moanabacter tarae]|uniref:SGNH hydrolase-type esterase domain-containing protein n=1 Tax=Candidatus Moanibacter tarae TaxID=2200854 RepID=A0A2Z4AG46_9BACT|nr:MAG: hypothetical protein DF168_01205 [Candidatus Moanabacter tarae]|tara:strand:- start:541 stop:1554 length:1014 start_codon:yes stop_codon:yes gene_type:complete
MIYEVVELHNVAETVPTNGGMRLQRVPENVRLELNEAAQIRVLQPDNCEIRFVCDDEPCYITLSSEGETNVTVFFGTFDGRERYTIGNAPTTIRLLPPNRLKELDLEFSKNQPFAPNVCRLICGGRCRDPLVLHAIEGKGIRPPRPDELPSIKYLAYGTSITHGHDCEGPHLNYVAQTAWHLGADLVNLGVAGACHCDPAFADYIAERKDWNIGTLALSVNMHGFPLDLFRERVSFMVQKVAKANKERTVACITLYPYFRDFDISDPNAIYGGPPAQYRQALRDAVNECSLPNLHLIEGPKLLTNIGGLTCDLIHPSDNGMIEMGRNLSSELKSLIN